MCGIVGKLNLDGTQRVDPGLIQRMMDVIVHRGPDGEGKYVSGAIGLGHRRLSIIDLNTGAQPMCNEDGTVWIVYNGEIYNFPDLRVELEAKGHRFRSTTDTEVIIHLYEEIGVKSVSRLRGMFAFAIWDERKKMLLLARDSVGVKPLYYINTGKAFLFASEIKSLLEDSSVKRNVNYSAIDRFLTYLYLPGNETLFKNIYKLEPGHYLTIQNGRTTLQQYWDLHFESTSKWKSLPDTIVELQQLLAQSVKDHMISDVPVGVLLSGGLDSTGVLRYASESTDKPIHTFTIGFSGANFTDERPYARLAAQRYRTIHREITISARDFYDFLPKYVWHMEEPICEPPAIALYFVSRLARESSVKVLLSGEGGDEAFGGYQNYRNLLLLERLKTTFGPAKGLLRIGLKALNQLGWRKIGRYPDLVRLPISQYYYSRTAMPNTMFNRYKRDLYTKEFSELIGGESSDAPTKRLFEQMDDKPLLNQMLYVDTKTWLPDDLLVKADKMTMATSVELRVPLLDFQILEFAAALPPQYKVHRFETKRILKAALEKAVPPEIIKRKKVGFPVPYERWLKSDLKHFISDTLLSQNSAVGDYFRREMLQEILEKSERGDSYPEELFCLMVLELWHKQFISSR